ncbi:hypothetical protein NC651_028128 [Populus alba x Populus x berolinensis]|nr:hypothetical protein NC651_028128 [Populus alba x Populus x berolinensis]
MDRYILFETAVIFCKIWGAWLSMIHQSRKNNKNSDRDGSQMNTACCAKLHGSLSGPCESAGSGMNKAFCRKDLPQDRTTWMEHHQTPLPFYGKVHVERDMAGFIQSRVVLLLPYEQS